MTRIYFLLVALFLWLFQPAHAREHAPEAGQNRIVLGVLAYRPKPIIQTHWQPLADYLQSELPGARFSLRVLGFSEMEDAVDKREVDVVLTNPAHYVKLSYRNGLSSPLVTLVNQRGEASLRHFGGVAVVRADRDDLRKLEDLRGKRISTPSVSSFGGYLVMANEMQQARMPLPDPKLLIETGMPHDLAIEMVLAGKSDAAFVRTSVFEDMQDEGKIPAGSMRVIHPQTHAGFPLVVSSRLYPEWVVAALPHLDSEVSNLIAVALLRLPHGGAIAKKMEIHGFHIPMDYTPVVELLKALRQPPFDTMPAFTVRDIWEKHHRGIILITVLVALILLLAFSLLIINRRLRELRARAEAGDARLRQLSQQLPGMLYQLRMRPDGSMHYPYASDAALTLFGVSPEALNESADNIFRLLHPEDKEQFLERLGQSADSVTPWKAEYRVILPDGRVKWLEGNARPQMQQDGSLVWHGFVADIDERKGIEARSELLATALKASANAIAITDVRGCIEWVNPAFVELTGYGAEELIGANPRILKSGLHDETFYSSMWHTLIAGNSWRGEIVNRRKDGTLLHEELMIAPVRNANGEIQHFIAVKQDIRERKRMEEELQRQATTDSLTGLPNRRYFFSRAESELARIKRGKAGAATLIMLDIDHFKRINDEHGHQVGDEVLRNLAATVSGNLRRSDVGGRIGGEEFVVMLPDTTAEQGHQFAERLREKIARTEVETSAGTIRYTSSFGVTAITADDAMVDNALARADAALYRAKEGGRNRVESS